MSKTRPTPPSALGLRCLEHLARMHREGIEKYELTKPNAATMKVYEALETRGLITMERINGHMSLSTGRFTWVTSAIITTAGLALFPARE